MRLTALAALAAAIALPSAAPALEAPRDYAGQWTISPLSEGPEACTVTLTEEGVIGGWAIDLPADCAGRFDLSPDIAAWTVYADGAIGFIDALRKPLVKFEPVPIGGYVAHRTAAEGLSLDRAGETRELTEQERMSGRWSLMSMGETLCAWTSTAGPDGMSGALAPAGDCRTEWRGVVKWERAKGRLMLIDGKGGMLRALPGDGIEGFFSPADSDETLGFVRD